jgi:hypothetical protein
MKRLWILLGLVSVLLVLWACVEQTDSEPANYSLQERWLCLPDVEDACDTDLTSTVVNADGTLQEETWQANPNADVDCFYVYPTVSKDLSRVSDFDVGPEERSVIQAQAARFGANCRVFAPVYRQVTIAGLQANLLSGTRPDMSFGYQDVLSAWQYYLQHHNAGRGVVLIGHSQGAHVLTRLIQEEIEGQPVMSQLISALLIGWNIEMPEAGSVGGTFKQLTPCTSSQQTGCFVAYSAFRDSLPPAEGSLFGFAATGNKVACVNPTALVNEHKVNEHNNLQSNSPHSYLVNAAVASQRERLAWVAGDAQPQTPFVSVPELLSATCVEREGASYLEISVHSDPEDSRTDDIAGDVVIAGKLQRQWGLHLIDMELTMGDLLTLVDTQARNYLDHQLSAK